MLRWITRLVLLLVLGVLAPGEAAAFAPVRVWPPAASAEKLASWGCDPETAVLRQAATMQAAETQQAASSLGYDFASGRLLAAERTGMGPDLETMGLRPAPGTRVRPDGVPEGWTIQPTKSGGGVQYVNPANTNQNVRVMQGNPNSPYPNSQAPYVRQQTAAGTYLRQDGTPSTLPKGGLHDGDAHIPLDQFIFRP